MNRLSSESMLPAPIVDRTALVAFLCDARLARSKSAIPWIYDTKYLREAAAFLEGMFGRAAKSILIEAGELAEKLRLGWRPVANGWTASTQSTVLPLMAISQHQLLLDLGERLESWVFSGDIQGNVDAERFGRPFFIKSDEPKAVYDVLSLLFGEKEAIQFFISAPNAYNDGLDATSEAEAEESRLESERMFSEEAPGWLDPPLLLGNERFTGAVSPYPGVAPYRISSIEED